MNYHEFIDSSASAFVEAPTMETFQNLADSLIRDSFEFLLNQIAAHAGAYWLIGEKDGVRGLTIAVNVGDRGKELEGNVFQPLAHGLVSEAFNRNELICHQGLFRHKKQSDDIDKELGQVTSHQISAPFSMFGHLIGSVTAIQSLSGGVSKHTKWGFDQMAIDRFQDWVNVSQRLFEYNFVQQIG